MINRNPGATVSTLKAFKLLLAHFSRPFVRDGNGCGMFIGPCGKDVLHETTFCMCSSISDLRYFGYITEDTRDEMYDILNVHRPVNKGDGDMWFPITEKGMKQRVAVLTKIVKELSPVKQKQSKYSSVWVIFEVLNGKWLQALHTSFSTRNDARDFRSRYLHPTRPYRIVKMIPAE